MKMSLFEEAFARLKYHYERIRAWLAYGSLVLLIVVIYGGDFLGPVRDILLPASAILVMAVLLESVFTLSSNVSIFLQTEEFESVVDALPRMLELIRSSKRDVQQVTMLVITGGTSLNALLPFFRHTGKKIDLDILLMDPVSPLMQYVPAHWETEIKTTLGRIGSEFEVGGNMTLKRCALYTNLPTVHGVLINGQHLFLGYVGWEQRPNGTVMAAAQLQHRYFSKNHFSESFFKLFDDWSRLAPSKPMDLSRDINEQVSF